MSNTGTIELRFPATMESVLAKRENYIAGIASRVDWEKANNTNPDDLASILDYLSSARVLGSKRDASHVDAVTLGYACGMSLDFPALFLDKRVDGARLNVYAIPKTLAYMRVLNGSAFRDDSDDNTNCATIIALVAKHSGGKKMWEHINATCSAFGMGGGNYGSGATQGGSSLRALAALGIVAKQGNNHAIVKDDMLAMLAKAAKARLKK